MLARLPTSSRSSTTWTTTGAASLGDLALVRLDDGTTRLTGPLVDQRQLHGLLARVRDLGVTLLTVRDPRP